jgi:lipoprotein-releasing system permease protein
MASTAMGGAEAVRVIVFIALRMLWDRRLLNSIAIVGVTLGVLTLIGINGIMQGFQQKFLKNILQVSPHVTVFDKELRPEARILRAIPWAPRWWPGWPTRARATGSCGSSAPTRWRRPSRRMEGVAAVSVGLNGSGILVFGGKELPVDLRGIDPTRQEQGDAHRPVRAAGELPELRGGERRDPAGLRRRQPAGGPRRGRAGGGGAPGAAEHEGGGDLRGGDPAAG